ncbi:hypothetical protein [Sphingomonas sp. Root710]|uniref:hypothetical protein n=1 Tax=Sphingomonas sp. Root710 TaxID=1736594 RepID=UPI0012E3635B|nr:hypothetical protein [Sphingomonas sp. Root710]
MEDLFLSADIGDSRRVCVSSISRQTYKHAVGSGLGGDRGYFVFEMDESQPGNTAVVLAKAPSWEAAVRLFDMITGSVRAAA